MLFVVLVVLLCIPPMRGLVQGRTATVTSSTANVSVSIRQVSLHFPLGLLIHNMLIMRPTSDTISIRRPSALLGLKDLGMQMRT